MSPARDDLIELFDYVFGRHAGRMDGLTDEEWAWCPTSDARVSIRWRLEHIAGLLSEERNSRWLGFGPPRQPPAAGRAAAARDAMAVVAEAYAAWRGLLASVSDADLAGPIGMAAGWHGDATRRSFVLHIADELIHHAAEAALLRDLYGARSHDGGRRPSTLSG